MHRRAGQVAMDLFVVIKLRDQLVEVKARLRLGNPVLQILDTVSDHSVIDILDGIKGNLALREETDDSPAVSAVDSDHADQHSGTLAVAIS